MNARHSWVKLKLHNYLCRRCGTGKRNAQRGGEWFTTWHKADGSIIVSAHVPACEIGQLTTERRVARIATTK